MVKECLRFHLATCDVAQDYGTVATDQELNIESVQGHRDLLARDGDLSAYALTLAPPPGGGKRPEYAVAGRIG